MKTDDSGFLIMMITMVVVAGVVIYLAILALAGIAAIAAAGGTLFGGGTALKNYFVSFKENIIDSNRVVVAE